MEINKKFVALAAAFAVLSAPVVSSAAEPVKRTHYRHHAYRYVHHPVVVANSDGWRKRDNAKGWDNTCINLPYLLDQYACGR
jgi:hypothetical protein